MKLINQLNTLESAGLVRLYAAQPELEYLFRHALVQDAAYGSLLKQDRRQLHLAVGETLERLYPDQHEEQAATLAHHFEKAAANDKAAHYFRVAGDRARAAYANTEAISFYQAALQQIPTAAAPAVGKIGAPAEIAAQLHESLGDVLGITGRHEEAQAAFQLALPQLPAEDRIGRARLHRKIGNTWVASYRFAETAQAYDQADLAIGIEPSETAVPAWREWIQTQVERFWLCYLQANVDELARLIEQTRGPLDQFGTAAQRSKFYEGLVLSGLRRDRFVIADETLTYAEATLTAAQETDSLSVIAHAQCVFGFVLLWRGALEQAEQNLLAAQQLCERIGDMLHQTINLTYLSVLYRKRGQIDEAQRFTHRALAIATETKMEFYIATANANLAWLAWRAGDLATTQTLAHQALATWRKQQSMGPFQWTALWPLIASALALDQVPEAVEYARALLVPPQQLLPENLTEAVEAVLRASEQEATKPVRTLLDRAVRLAQETDYL